MNNNLSDSFSSDEETSPEKMRQRAAIMKKLQKLTGEDDPEMRRQLTHKLTIEISQMLRENQDMKEELIAFVKRLRG